MHGRSVKVHGRKGNEKWRRLLLLAAAATLSACAGDEVRLLREVERIAVPEAVSTLAVDSSGSMWMGVTEGIWIRDTTGKARRINLPGTLPPRAIAWSAGVAYLRAGDSLYVLAAEADTLLARRGGFATNPVRLDPRGRALYQGARSGAVLAHDPQTLEPLWAWAALGSPTTAIALSPLGDRLYQALGGERDPHLLIRDLQTGRVLGRAELQEPLEQLVASPSGDLYGLSVEARRVVALRPEGEGVIQLWRTALPHQADGSRASLGLSGERLYVIGFGEETRLQLLSTAEGAIVGRTRDDPLDAAAGPGGALWVLFRGEVRRLE